MGKTKIEWCDWTWNPVWGCTNGCPYCYARGIARRFGEKMYLSEMKCRPGKKDDELKSNIVGFKPEFLFVNYAKQMPSKPSRIFVNSMSDISCWPIGAMDLVLQEIRENPWHKYLFLTKNPEIYSKWKFPENCWLGLTLTLGENPAEKLYEMESCCDFSDKVSKTRHRKFISFEPLHGGSEEDIDVLKLFRTNFDWIILGAESGSRKGKVIPEFKWIFRITLAFGLKYIPIFMKDSIQPYWTGELYRQFPKEVSK
jgi:protein gp37